MMSDVTRPPGRSELSTTRTSLPASCNVIAALKPARPAPTIKTSEELGMSSDNPSLINY